MAIPGEVGPADAQKVSSLRRQFARTRRTRVLAEADLEASVVERDTLEGCRLVESERTLSVDERDEALHGVGSRNGSTTKGGSENARYACRECSGSAEGSPRESCCRSPR